MPRSLAILIPYFGRWPARIDFSIETRRGNPDIDWFLYTDCGAPGKMASRSDRTASAR